jgi:hypothetical protein
MSLAQTAPYQGANYLECFSIATDTAVTSVFAFTKNIDSTLVGHPAKGALTIQIANKTNNEDYNNFLNTFLSTNEITEQKVTYEDGATETVVSGADTTKYLAAIWYDGHVGTKRKVAYGCAVLSGNTGDSKTIYGNIGDFPVELKFIQYGSTLTFPTAKFKDTLVSQAQQTITATEVGKISFMTKA